MGAQDVVNPFFFSPPLVSSFLCGPSSSKQDPTRARRDTIRKPAYFFFFPPPFPSFLRLDGNRLEGFLFKPSLFAVVVEEQDGNEGEDRPVSPLLFSPPLF